MRKNSAFHYNFCLFRVKKLPIMAIFVLKYVNVRGVLFLFAPIGYASFGFFYEPLCVAVLA